MNKKTFLLTIFSTIYTVNSQAATPTCATMPTCESLGYSKSIASDCTQSLSCPFDTAYKICLKKKEKCAVGDIFYSDMSCTSAANYDSSKKAVGVVFMLTDCNGNLTTATTSNHGRVVNLHDLYVSNGYTFSSGDLLYGGTNPGVYWGLENTSISTLQHYTDDNVKASGSLAYALKNNVSDIYDGRSNTNKILTAVSSVCSCAYNSGTKNEAIYCRAPAVEAANAFYPAGVSSTNSLVGSGKWYLPSIGELAYLYGINTSSVYNSSTDSGATGTTKTIVNNTLSVLASTLTSGWAATLTEGYYWSSTPSECSGTAECAWHLSMKGGYRYTSSCGSTMWYVRTVLAF
jgi:hypothetical protein